VYSETLAMCLVTTGGYLAIRALQNASPWYATGAGALFGIAYLGRPEALAFAGAAAGVLFVAAFAQRRGWQVAFRNAALTSVAALLIAAPYVAFLSSHAGAFRWESKSSLNAPVNARMAQNMSYPEAARGLNPDLTPAGPHLYADQFIVFRQPSAGLKVLLETGLSDPIGRAVSIARDLISAAFLGSPWIFLAAFAGVVASRWWRTATWEGLLWLSFCGLQFLFLFLLQYTFTRYFFPLLAVLIPLAAGGIALLWSVPALARRPAVAASACGGVACLIALASYSDTRQVGELLQSADRVASEAGEWMKTEYAKGDRARARPVVMGYGLVTTYYAEGDFGYMPYADEALALRYIHKLAPDFLVVRSSELRQAPYFGPWLERGIEDECASPGFETTSPSGEVIKVWRWRCQS
jgi:MFS family permease